MPLPEKKSILVEPFCGFLVVRVMSSNRMNFFAPRPVGDEVHVADALRAAYPPIESGEARFADLLDRVRRGERTIPRDLQGKD